MKKNPDLLLRCPKLKYGICYSCVPRIRVRCFTHFVHGLGVQPAQAVHASNVVNLRQAYLPSQQLRRNFSIHFNRQNIIEHIFAKILKQTIPL